MIQIIEANQLETWNNIILSLPNHDFYHLAQYHQLDSSGKSLLFVYQKKEIVIAFPFIVRQIEGTDYYDITSVYGYAGPLASTGDFKKETIDEFQRSLKLFFDEKKIIAAFSRLHPFVPEQTIILDGLGIIENTSSTVGIDMSLSEQEQKKQYARSLKNRINYLKRVGVEIVRQEEESDIDVFIDMYYENMRRVKASENYFFPRSYFYDTLKNLNSFILFAKYNNEYIGGALFVECNGFLHAHFNAVKTDFLHFSPLKIILDAGRLYGVRKGVRYYHLGGGFLGKKDTLFMFKSRFSKTYYQFRTWKYIHNAEIYTELANMHVLDRQEKTSFFPVYRVNN